MVTTDTILDSYLPLDAAEFANFFISSYMYILIVHVCMK